MADWSLPGVGGRLLRVTIARVSWSMDSYNGNPFPSIALSVAPVIISNCRVAGTDIKAQMEASSWVGCGGKYVAYLAQKNLEFSGFAAMSFKKCLVSARDLFLKNRIHIKLY